jgi:AraC-like DNA-binding protein
VGDVLYIAKGTTYYSIWNGRPRISFYSITCDFDDPYAKREYAFQVVHAPQCRELFEKLYRQYASGISFALLETAYRLLDVLFPLLTPTATSPAERTVLPAIAHLEQHYTEDVNVEQLARLCGFSQSRFFTLFKRATNATPIQYKNNILVQHALELLAETSMTVDEISHFLGFSSPAYFRRVFRNVTGRTPKELR